MLLNFYQHKKDLSHQQKGEYQDLVEFRISLIYSKKRRGPITEA